MTDVNRIEATEEESDIHGLRGYKFPDQLLCFLRGSLKIVIKDADVKLRLKLLCGKEIPPFPCLSHSALTSTLQWKGL